MAVVIPAAELQFLFSRSGGPGGQNVNRRETRVQLRFDLANSAALTDVQKTRVRADPGFKHLLDTSDVVQIAVDTHRSQQMNMDEAIARLHELLAKALRPRKKRVPTKATRGSKERRLKEKKHRSRTKADRRGGGGDAG